MGIDQITEIAQKIDPHTKTHMISPLSGGFSSQAYKVNATAPFVLLVERDGGVSRTNYGHAYVVLTLLNEVGYEHSPRPLWLSEDHRALALEYIEGESAETIDFAKSSMDTMQLAMDVIGSLLDTAIVSYEEYIQTAQKYNVTPLANETPQTAAEQYGTQWFGIVAADCPDAHIVEWLRPRIAQSVALAPSFDTGKPTFCHGDPSNPNILIKPDGTFVLIDWDSARFNQSGPEWMIAYCTHLTDFMKPYRQEIIAHVAEKIGASVDDLTKHVQNYRQFSEIFDVNWAAMMMAKVASGKVEGNLDTFRKIANERIEIYEKSFGNTIR